MRSRSSLFRRAAAAPVALEAVEQLPVTRLGRGRPVDHDDVEARQLRLLLAKRLSDYYLYSVPCRGAAAVFFRNRETEPRDAGVVTPAQYRKQVVPAASRLVEYAAEGRRIQEPVVLAEPVAWRARQS